MSRRDGREAERDFREYGFAAGPAVALARRPAPEEAPARAQDDDSLGDVKTRAWTDGDVRALRPGTVLAARYEVRTLIGAGAIGAVYRARDRVRSADVALKVLYPSVFTRESALARFGEWGRVSLALAHDGLARVYDVGEDPQSGLRFLAMELLEGTTLRAWLDERRRRGESVRPEAAVEVASQVLEALRYAHARTIHRALTPHNVRLEPGARLRVKVLDLGLARVAGSVRTAASATSRGAAFYLAPELQLGIGPVDERADVYSVAAMLYEMLTGAPPAGRVRAPSERRPREVSPAFDPIVLAGLEPEPDARPRLQAFQARLVALGRQLADAAALRASGRARRPGLAARLASRAAGLTVAACFGVGLALLLAVSLHSRDGGSGPPTPLAGAGAGSDSGSGSAIATAAAPAARPPGPAGVVPDGAPGAVAAPGLAAIRDLATAPATGGGRSAAGWWGEPLGRGLRRGADRPVCVLDTGRGLALEMVYVPPGDGVMGADDADSFPDERPRHVRRLARGFWIGRHETTWREYRAFCRATARAEPPTPPFPVADDHPVVGVTWEDARAFCAWLGLRLPSEAEWERAARGTEGRLYPWGDGPPTSERCASIAPAPGTAAAPAPVGRRPLGASPFGALDMAGNVWEWCEDWYDEDAYARHARGDGAPPARGPFRAIRGGGPVRTVGGLRASNRNGDLPHARSPHTGFRVAMSSE